MEETKMSGKTQKIDMCHGPLLSGIIAFSLPLMLSGCLQLLCGCDCGGALCRK